MTLMETAVLALIGSLAGTLGGLLGIGGSIIMIPGMLLLFGYRYGAESQHLYQAAAMMVNFVVAGSSAVKHYRAGAMIWPVLKFMIPVAAAGSVAGVYISNLPCLSGQGTIWLARIFGLVLFYAAAQNIWRLFNRGPAGSKADPAPVRTDGWLAALLGVPIGLSGGLLGIGGGVMAVPLQQVLMRVPLPKAIANSAMTIVFVSSFGAVYKNLTLGAHSDAAGQPYTIVQAAAIALVLFPTALVSAYLGAFLTHWLRLEWLRVAFAALMLYGGYKLITRQPPPLTTSATTQIVRYAPAAWATGARPAASTHCPGPCWGPPGRG